MECKKCGHILPPVGFNCTNCGMMMSAEQIKIQKDNRDLNKKSNIELVSEKYGHKDFIYEKRENSNKKYLGILIVIGILILIALATIIVYL